VVRSSAPSPPNAVTLPFLDPRDFDAKWDNSTDDTSAINAALAAAVSLAPSDGLPGNDHTAYEVVMPPGHSVASVYALGGVAHLRRHRILYESGVGYPPVAAAGAGGTGALVPAYMRFTKV
jgi:hypothetical protein